MVKAEMTVTSKFLIIGVMGHHEVFSPGKVSKGHSSEMSQILGEKCHSYSTVKTWISHFKTGHFTVDDEPRSGSSRTASDTATCDAVHEMTLKDRRISAQKIAQILDIYRECTRFLKLVRNQNGNWQALPCDSDLAPVTLERDENAPIDPVQLLNALASLLSPDGGIKSIEEVARLSSLMKKFSKKLVSRCVYCNVLQATKPEILTVFLDESGWNTINVWLQDAKNSNNSPFLCELLQLCKVLPMTVERLKQNNTARLVKSLTKFDNNDVKELSCELVKKWMTIVKGETNSTSDSGSDKKKKKKEKEPTVEKDRKEDRKIDKIDKDKNDRVDKDKNDRVDKDKNDRVDKANKSDKIAKIDKNVKVVLENDLKIIVEKTMLGKEPAKLKGHKRTSKDKETSDIYEDVKIDPEPLVKKAKIVDRPKTVKLFNKKFRATGLEEETPLPKPVNKKASTVSKPVAAPVAKTGIKRVHPPSLSERSSEKKIKPESLVNNVENSNNHNGGIKLIPPKPRSAHILHESASFMDALVAQPAAVPKKKKKVLPNKPSTPPTPPSPTLTPPKLEFYKDTLEMDENEESADKKTSDAASKEKPSSPPRDKKELSEESPSELDENPPTPIDPAASNVDLNIDGNGKEVDNGKDEPKNNSEAGPVLRSILTHGKRPERKKSVRFVEDSNLKEVFYFEMDETERVNVNHMHHNFGDLKSLEMKREREAFEAARRQLGDRMEEVIPWWIEPICIDFPPPLVTPGCRSKEKEIQQMKQQSTLQEIYFTREMVPDSPQEPELEIFSTQEPKIIPLDDEFHLGTVMDYTQYEMPAPKTGLPDVLTSLMNIPKRKMSQQPPIMSHIPEQQQVESNRLPHPVPTMNMSSPYDSPDPVPQGGLLGIAPPSHMFSSPPGPEMDSVPMSSDWRPMEPMGVMAPDQYFGGYPSNRPVMIDHMHQSVHGRGEMRPPRMNGPLIMPDMYHPSISKGPNMPRPTASSRNRPRTPCRHFLSGGCRFGASCNFLHPGVNGPPL